MFLHYKQLFRGKTRVKDRWKTALLLFILFSKAEEKLFVWSIDMCSIERKRERESFQKNRFRVLFHKAFTVDYSRKCLKLQQH